MRTLKVLAAVICICICIFTVNSCRKKGDLSAGCDDGSGGGDIDGKSAGQSIYVKKDYLVFSDRNEVKKAIDFLRTLSEAQKDNWERSYPGFESMRAVFNDIVGAEEQVALKYENLSAEALDILANSNEPVEHSEIAKKNAQMLITTTTSDGGSFFDKNIPNEMLSAIVNKKGLVEVNDTIYQFTYLHAKALTDGDEGKIDLLLETTVSVPDKAIIVAFKNNNGGAIDPGGGLWLIDTGGGWDGTTGSGGSGGGSTQAVCPWGSWVESCISNNGRYRVILYIDFVQQLRPTNSNVIETTFKFKVRSLKRRLFGVWYDNYSANLSASGNYNGNTSINCQTQATEIWSGGYAYNSASKTHTFEYPIQVGCSECPAPEVYGGSHTAHASDEKTVSCTVWH